jgi:multiple sugar transport system ATP-binding protein
VASFIGSPRINTLAAEVGGDGAARVAGVPVDVRAARPGPVTLAVRPEDLKIADGGLPSRVEQVEFLGDSMLLHARHEAGGEALIARLPGSDRPRLAVGSTVLLAADPKRTLLFDAAGKRVRSSVASRAMAHG